MSRIDELIKRLCPNGVALIPMKDVSEIKRGDRITKKDITSDGNYIVMSGGVNPMGRYSNKNRNANTITISSYGAAGYVNYIEEDFWANDVCLSVFPNEEVLNKKYLYYVLKSKQQYIFDNTTKAIPDHIPTRFLEELPIPIPPLEVQSEIVRILDNFTELTAELTAELAFRKKQYEYYKEVVFSKYCSDSTRFVPLDSIADVRDGTHESPKPSQEGKYLITSKNIKNGTITYDGAYLISEDDYNAINNRSKVNITDLLFTMIGTVGEVGIVLDEPDFAIKNVGLIKTGNETKSRFLKHYLTSAHAKKYIEENRSKGSQVFLALGKLRKMPIPEISECDQNEIVEILDRFDSLVTDIDNGLPAEIDVRNKQYEFYRDRLLTFDELKVA